METTIKERVKAIANYYKMGQNKFEKTVGWSSGFIFHMKDNLSIAQATKIFDTFPDVSEDWLLRGVGSMIKVRTTDAPQPPISANQNIDHGSSGVQNVYGAGQCSQLEEQLVELRKQNSQKDETIALLTSIIKDLRKTDAPTVDDADL